MKKSLIAIICFGLFACSYELAEPIVTADGYKQIIRKGITFQWQDDGTNLTVVLEAPTTGWVGVGLKANSLMEGANILIGYVEDSTNTTISDRYGTDEYTHVEDIDLGGSEDYTFISGSETNSTTRVSFSILLDSEDDYDRQLVPGNNIKCFLAYGEGDTITNEYVFASFFGIEL